MNVASILFYWCGGGNEHNQAKEKGIGNFSEGVKRKTRYKSTDNQQNRKGRY